MVLDKIGQILDQESEILLQHRLRSTAASAAVVLGCADKEGAMVSLLSRRGRVATCRQGDQFLVLPVADLENA